MRLGRSFNLFWAGQAVSNVGDRITIFVVPTVMIFLLHASPLQVGIVAMAQYLGIPLIGPIAGMLVDRWDNRLTLVMCDLIRLLAVAALPIAYWLGVLSTPLLFICVAFVSGCSIVFTVGYLVAVPTTVDQQHLVRAYSRLEGTRSVAEVSGPSIAAALYHALGIAALVVDAASFLVSAVCIRFMQPFGEKTVATGSVWSRLGSEVTVVEMLDRVAPGLDAEVAKQLQRVLSKQELIFKLATKVVGIDTKGSALKLILEPSVGGKSETLESDVVLVAIGRIPNTEGLDLADVGVKTDNQRRIVVDEKFATNIPGIYAIGDVIKGPMLAHKAEEEGVALAEILAGQAGHVNYDVIPSVIYTAPEVASVGKTEEELKDAGIDYKVGKFPFTANGRAKVNRTTEGFVKILADEATDRVLGVHIIGADAGTMIAEAAVLMEFGGSAEDLARACHAHPTLNEAVKEAALAVDKRAIHI